MLYICHTLHIILIYYFTIHHTLHIYVILTIYTLPYKLPHYITTLSYTTLPHTMYYTRYPIIHYYTLGLEPLPNLPLIKRFNIGEVAKYIDQIRDGDVFLTKIGTNKLTAEEVSVYLSVNLSIYLREYILICCILFCYILHTYI